MTATGLLAVDQAHRNEELVGAGLVRPGEDLNPNVEILDVLLHRVASIYVGVAFGEVRSMKVAFESDRGTKPPLPLTANQHHWPDRVTAAFRHDLQFSPYWQTCQEAHCHAAWLVRIGG